HPRLVEHLLRGRRAVFAGFAVFLWYRVVRDAWERDEEDALAAEEAAMAADPAAAGEDAAAASDAPTD
ncbi:MAG: hypothetical protein ABI310_09900, partial [Microbacteriaceae bacterium]